MPQFFSNLTLFSGIPSKQKELELPPWLLVQTTENYFLVYILAHRRCKVCLPDDIPLRMCHMIAISGLILHFIASYLVLSLLKLLMRSSNKMEKRNRLVAFCDRSVTRQGVNNSIAFCLKQKKGMQGEKGDNLWSFKSFNCKRNQSNYHKIVKLHTQSYVVFLFGIGKDSCPQQQWYPWAARRQSMSPKTGF